MSVSDHGTGLSRCAVALACLMGLAACQSDNTQGLADGGSTADAGLPAAPPTCAKPLTLGQTFPIDPVGKGQFQMTAAFDGTLWLAYNKVATDGTANFDIWAERMGCDGQPVIAPFKVNTSQGADHFSPNVVLGQGTVLIVWHTDDGSGANNLSIRYRLFKTDGTPLTGVETVLQTSLNGHPVAVNAWQQSATAVPDGTFAIAGVRGAPGVGAFRAFVQRIDASGNPTGATIDAETESSAHQNAAITAGSDGTLYVAWERASDTLSVLPIVHAKIAPGASVMSPSPAVQISSGRLGEVPAMTTGFGATGRHYLAFDTPFDHGNIVSVMDADNLSPDAPVRQLSGAQELGFAATVAASDTGGAVAWFSETQTNPVTVRVARFTYDGTTWASMSSIAIPAGAAASHNAPALVHIDANTYFIGWSDGINPNTTLHGRFIALE